MLNYFTNVGYNEIIKGKSCHFKQFQNINGTVFKAEKLTLLPLRNTMNVRNCNISHNAEKAVQR